MFRGVTPPRQRRLIAGGVQKWQAQPDPALARCQTITQIAVLRAAGTLVSASITVAAVPRQLNKYRPAPRRRPVRRQPERTLQLRSRGIRSKQDATARPDFTDFSPRYLQISRHAALQGKGLL
jgi:hypothetical protein